MLLGLCAEELIGVQAKAASLPLINPLPNRKCGWMKCVQPQLLCRTSTELTVKLHWKGNRGQRLLSLSSLWRI